MVHFSCVNFLGPGADLHMGLFGLGAGPRGYEELQGPQKAALES